MNYTTTPNNFRHPPLTTFLPYSLFQSTVQLGKTFYTLPNIKKKKLIVLTRFPMNVLLIISRKILNKVYRNFDLISRPGKELRKCQTYVL